MVIYLFLILISLPCVSYSRGIAKIAVIDTGLDVNDDRFKELICGYRDLTGEGIEDKHGHGTHIAGLIKQYAENAHYCLYIIKFYSERASNFSNTSRMAEAIRDAANSGAKIVNISGGGGSFSEIEYLAIKNHPKVRFIVAAGNDGANLDKSTYKYYPACYNLKNITAVGALGTNNKRLHDSNYGSNIKTWEVGENILSTLPNGENGVFSGTSMATAIHTGKVIHELY
jgi:subtilisin family serine protease